MTCPNCQHEESRIIRSAADGTRVERQRQCAQCGWRWNTVEASAKEYEHLSRVLALTRELRETAGEG